MLTVFGEVRGPFALGRLRASANAATLPSGLAIARARVEDALAELQEAWIALDLELRRDEDA